MDYQTFEPCKDLSTLVKCYWTLTSMDVNQQEQTIVPDGCMEMIFHCGDLYQQRIENGKTILQPRSFVIGQLTRPLIIIPTGVTDIFSVRFYPEGFLPFASIPIKEMENKAVSIEKLFGRDGLEIDQLVLNARSTSEKINLIQTFLLSRLASAETIDRIIKSTIETILQGNGQLSVADLSQKIDINRRRLERKFSSAIGLSPKQLSKTIRLQATLKMLINKNFTSLTALAYEGKYYDQAHFIKDFKEFTGLTPKEFYGNNVQMTSLFCGSE